MTVKRAQDASTPAPRKKRDVRPANSRTTTQAIENWERAHNAVQLRRTGMNWDDIATKLGYGTRGAAYNAATRFMKDYPREDAEALRDLEADRLDQVQKALWPRCMDGDPRAAEVYAKIAERRSRLMGSDKPDRKELTVLTEDVVDKALREAKEEMERRARTAQEQGIELPTGGSITINQFTS